MPKNFFFLWQVLFFYFLFSIFFILGCGTDLTETGGGADTTAPTVASVLATATSEVSVVFSESVKETSAETTANYMISGLIVSAATLESDAKTVTLSTAAQTQGTTYRITIESVADLAGNVMTTYTATFSAYSHAPPPDTVSPEVSSVSPTNGSTSVATTAAVSVVFSEAMDDSSLNTAAFTLSGAGSSVVGGVNYTASSKTATFTPLSPLAYLRTYIAVISSNVTDSAGNKLAGNYTWSFTTVRNPDVSAPTVSSVEAASATQVQVLFSEPMTESLAETITNYSISYNPSLAITSASLGADAKTLTLTTAAQEAGRTYNITIEGVTDLAGNTLEAYTTTFAAYSNAPDTTAPAFGGLTAASVVSSSEIQLNWSAASDTISTPANLRYLIYQSTSELASLSTDGFETRLSYTTAAGATSYNVTSLDDGTTYYFVVRASDEARNIDTNMVERNARTTDATPPTFSGLTSATAAGSAEINLVWSAASDISIPITYYIYRATTSGGQNFNSALATTTTTAYTASGLSDYTFYYFVVRASDEAGNIDTNRVERNARTTDATPPTFAGATSASGASTTEVTINWTAATDNASAANNLKYLVYQSTATLAAVSTPNYITAAGATSYMVSGLDDDILYYFVVRASDEAGNIDTNLVNRSSRPNDGTPPTFAGLLQASQTGSDRVLLVWPTATDNISADDNIGYYYYYSTTSGGQNFSNPTTATNPTLAGNYFYTVTGLSASTEYHFVVRAVDEAL